MYLSVTTNLRRPDTSTGAFARAMIRDPKTPARAAYSERTCSVQRSHSSGASHLCVLLHQHQEALLHKRRVHAQHVRVQQAAVKVHLR